MADDEFKMYMENWPDESNPAIYKKAIEFLDTLTPEENEDLLLFESADQFTEWKKFQSSHYKYTKQELKDLLHRRRLIHDRWLEHILSKEEYQRFLKCRKEHYKKRKRKKVPSKQEFTQNMKHNPFVV